MKVAIVGAGLAGLHTAALLEAHGVDVAVFEASSALGGRVRTARPAPGIAYEAGGEWIDADHARMRALLDELGAPARPAPPSDGWVVLGADRVRRSALWADADADEDAVWDAGRVAATAQAAAGWRGPAARGADTRTLAAFVAEHARTPRGRAWVDVLLRGDEGHDLDHVGLLGWLLGVAPTLDRAGAEGGAMGFSVPSDELIRRMAARVRGEIRTQAVVSRVAATGPQGVTLEIDGALERFSRVVFAVSPPALRALAIPGLSPRKRAALAATGTSRVLKVALAYERPWWDPFGGRTWTDGPVQQTWAPVQAEGHVLIGYICGRRADRLLKDGAPVEDVHDALATLFPGARHGLIGGWAHDWQATPHVGVAHVHLRPGIGTDGGHLAAAAAPHGRLHFAGSWTAHWHGFMEGALESAERVVEEITFEVGERHARAGSSGPRRVL